MSAGTQETASPASEVELADAIRSAAQRETPVYPVGGGTALDFGLPATAPGVALSLEALQRVVDYPARDMTVTVEAGITMGALARVLAAEKQQL
ncbi:MAG: FAD-binding protein, partial [Pirellulales bacterium]